MSFENESKVISSIARRAFAYATKMIYDANHRDDVMIGDPKVGGHPASCSSCVHIMSALHLGAREAADLVGAWVSFFFFTELAGALRP